MAQLVLVNHWSPGIGNNKPPLGLCYLASYLKEYLHFNDIQIINTGDKTFEKIKQSNPEIVGFTAYTAGYYDVSELMKKVKQALNCHVIVGGPHITCLPHQLPESADIGVIGEGEQTLLELLKLYLTTGKFDESQLHSIHGIVFRENNKLHFTAPRALIKPIDKIPLPDRDLLEMDYFLQPSQILMNNEFLRGTTMLTSRGCPYNCIYCHVSAKWGKPRLHSAERVVEEIEYLYSKYHLEAITMSDDLFVSSPKRIADILEGLKKRNILGKIRFLVDLRANLVNEKLMKNLKEMGVVKIALGLESGSDRILRYLKGESVTVEMNRQAVKIANKFGIGCHCCFMIGAPPETKNDILQTQQLIREILDMSSKNFCQLTVTTPLPGTQLWDYAIEKAYITENIDWRQFSLSPTLSKRKDFYVNEHIDFDEFLVLAKETQELTNSRRLKSILSNFSWRYFIRMFDDPRLAFKIVKDYLKFK
jgi:anaerobic magnesium-protoporphyrin IX monomethyl ester cyclase